VSSLQAMLDEGVQSGAFPSAQAVVIRSGSVFFEGCAGDASPQTRFDLASLTKVLCTTPVLLSLWGEGKLGPEAPLARFLPEAAASRAGVRLSDLLYHRSGLPAFRPLFAEVMPRHPELFEAGCSAGVRARARAEAVERAMEIAPEAPIGARAVYSDLGFILLGEALSRAAGQPLDALYRERVAAPLGLGSHFRRLSTPNPDEPIAPTGTTRPREPAPGQEGMWNVPPHPGRPGEVDDDNAWAMDGVAGHAGLFGTAGDVARLGQAVLDELAGKGRLAAPELWRRAMQRDPLTPGSTRALGFDTPSETGSAAGTLIGKLPPGAVGHTGFTGVALFVDVARKLVIALNTNRTRLGRANVAIREFRPRFHDAAARLSGG